MSRPELGTLEHLEQAIVDALADMPTRRDLFLAVAMAGYNANPDETISNTDSGLKAIWAEEDAEALLAVGSDDRGAA